MAEKVWEFGVLRYKVIDANTVRCLLDVGFHTSVERNLDLDGLEDLPSRYNPNPMKGAEAQEAMATVHNTLALYRDITGHVTKGPGGWETYRVTLFGRKTSSAPYVNLNEKIKTECAHLFEVPNGS